MHPCTEFGVASSKFTFTGGPHVKTASSPLARAAGTPLERYPKWILSWYSTRVTCEFGFSGCSRLTPRGARKFLVVLYGTARATCHVPPVDPRPAPLSFRRFGASIGATPVPIGPAVGGGGHRTFSLPNLVAISQNFLNPEDPSQMNFAGPGTRSLHRTGTVTTKACLLGKHTCYLHDWHQPCPLFGL